MYVYPIIQPPFTLKFREMTKSELDDYYKWFMNQIPERIAILERAVKATPGFEDWNPSYLPESLDKLGEWFACQVETRLRTGEEIQEIREKSPPLLKDIHIDDYELTNRTFSLAMDIGMYLSQVMLKSIPNLEWKQIIKGSKHNIDYGQPVLGNFGKVDFNPVQIMVTQAYGINRQTRKGNSLRRLYDIWKGLSLAPS